MTKAERNARERELYQKRDKSVRRASERKWAALNREFVLEYKRKYYYNRKERESKCVNT